LESTLFSFDEDGFLTGDGSIVAVGVMYESLNGMMALG
jgi:hypothetical protein